MALVDAPLAQFFENLLVIDGSLHAQRADRRSKANMGKAKRNRGIFGTTQYRKNPTFLYDTLSNSHGTVWYIFTYQYCSWTKRYMLGMVHPHHGRGAFGVMQKALKAMY
jgi:hypothetical protein